MTAPFAATAKNQPAANFLEAVGSGHKQETDTGVVYRIPAAIAIQTTYQPGAGAKEALELARSDGKKVKAQGVASGVGGDKSAFYSRLATDLRRVEMVQRAVEAFARGTRPDLETLLVEPRTKRERDLAELWARLLHLDRVGIRDDFSALGGTSLVAAQIFAEIEQRFGSRLPMTTILEAPTVEQLAEKLEGDVRASLKLLRPGQKGGPALFFAHDGDGETLLYLNLARRLPEEVAVYGLEPLGSTRCPCLHTRIPEMAAYYLEQIRRVRPVGPYFLAGMCAGGVIAYEMASQLLAKGERVGFVALLDAAAPRTPRRVGLTTQRRGARFLQALRDKPRTGWWQRFTGRASVVVGKAWNLLVYEAKTRTRWLAHRMRFGVLRSALDRGRRLPAWAEGLTVRTIYELAEREYVPAGKLDAPVILFRATTGEGSDEPFIHRYADELLGWSRYVEGPVELLEVPGGHASMLQEPHVSTLVEHVRAAIERALPVEVAS